MSKLKLSLENLSVESFDTTATGNAKGTVFGEQCTCYTNCTCPGCPTCDATCPQTCANTCDDATCGCNSGNSCGGTTCVNTCGCAPSSICQNSDIWDCEAN